MVNRVKTVLRCGQLIDGTGAPPRKDAVVILDDGRIAAVGGPELEAGAENVLDLSNRTVLPGLIDAHVHICLDGSPDAGPAKTATPQMAAFRAANSLGQALRAGVTTYREAGAPHGVSFAAKEAMARGLVEGPRLLVSGQALCATGGQFWQMNREVDGPHEARKGAREQLRNGADVIKLMATGGVVTPSGVVGAPEMTVEEMTAAVEEAHKAGKRVMAHAMGPVGIRNALAAGADTIEHGVSFGPEEIELMLKHDVYLVPTLAIMWAQAEVCAKRGIPKQIADKVAHAIELTFRNVPAAARVGVKIAMGTDAGGAGITHSMAALELELLYQSGTCTTRMDAILSATSRAAGALGLAGELGTIEPGKMADVLVLDRDPLEDLAAFRRVAMVIQAGRVVHQLAMVG